MESSPKPKIKLMLEGEKKGVIKMVTAMLAMFQAETIKIYAIKCNEEVKVKQDDGEETTLENVIEIIFDFKIFEEEAEVNPYLEKLREQAETLVNELTKKEQKKEAVEEHKELETPMKK
jgi:hypothetical protein